MRESWLQFAFLGLHPERARTLLERHGGVEGAVAAVACGGESETPPLVSVDDCRSRLAESESHFDVAAEAAWSRRFRYLPDRPEWLFRRGEVGGGRFVAIVGTRRCTEYGRRTAFGFAAACAEAGWVVVSGLARGIDGAAHRGAVAAGGRTVAVLGCGPDVAYPREHTFLRNEIVGAGGGVITEYPPGAAPLGWRFPPRNRIISGLSSAVVVIESAVKGGSLSTASRAVGQGRVVLAVPGDIDREASVGCNLLIRDGAVPVLGADDLVAALSLVGDPSSR